jgi:hypothetical protein
MKNIIYPFMTMVAAAAALVSCTREETEVNEQTEYVYRFELVEGETKATLDNEGVWWEADKDHVGVIVGDENIQADVVESEGKKVISFTSESAIEEGTPIYSYYPYSQAITSAAEAQVTIPTEQEGGSVSAMPMAGIPIHLESAAGATSNGTINFMNLGAIIAFRVYSTNAVYANETVESITFWSDYEEQKVSGTAPIDLTEVTGGDSPSAPTIALDTPSYRRATVTQSASVVADKDDATPIYLVVAPGTFVSGKIVVNTNAASYTFTYTNKSFARNSIKKFSMNLGGSNVEREAMTKTYTNIGTNQLSEGTYLLVAYDNSSSGDGAGTYICWIPNTGNGSAHQERQVISHIKYSTSNEASVASDGLENRSGDIIGSEVIIEQYDNKWLVKVKNTGQYLYCPNENYRIGFTTNKSLAGHTWTLTTGSNIYFDSGDYHFYHSGSEKGFSYRTTAESQYSYNVRFYKLSGSTKPQTISFENVPENGFTWDIGENTGTYTKPNLVGVKTTVIYSSSNTNIAEVDSMSGNVTFGSKTGTVTITATAAGEDGYASATASYTIVVSNSNATPTTYYKASVLEAGEEYIIVYGSNAMKNDAETGTLGVEDVSVSNNNTISLVEASDFLWTAAAGFTLKNGDYYLYRGSNGLRGNNSSSNWDYDGEYLWTTVTSSSWGSTTTTTYYAYYDGGWKSQTAKPSGTILLFNDRPAPALFFENADNLTYDLSVGGDFAKPTLNNPGNYDVTYDTSNHDIATVDSEGNVSFNSNNVTGTVIVYARIASNEDHQGAEASYEIAVTSPHYYMRVTSIETGSKYLIVNENSNTAGKVFKPSVSNGAFANTNNTVDVQISNGIILEPAAIDECPFEFESSTTSGTYHLKTTDLNPNYYLYLSSSKMTAAENKPGDSYVFKPEFANNGTVTLKRNSSNYYIAYVNGNFQYNGSASGSIALYKYVAGVPKQSQTVVFEDGSDKEWTFGVECELNGVYDLLKLDAGASSYSTALTYNAPTPEGVAEIVEVEGVKKVKIVGAGSTTISVTAAEDATHFAATASFQLTVNKGTQTIAYNPANVEAQYDLASSSWTVAKPTLDASGVKTQVAYESSNTNVATVGNDGTVTLVEPITKGATATITATAQESADYNSASASFSLKVVNSNAPLNRYTKVSTKDDFDTKSKYVIVYENGASSKVFKPIRSGNTFEASANNALNAEVSDGELQLDTELEVCHVTFEATGSDYYLKAGDYYLYPSNSNLGAEATASRPLTITFTNGKVKIKRNNYDHYLAFNSYFLRASSDSGNLALYKLDDGQPKNRNLAFSESSMSVNIYGETTPYILTGTPTLTGKGLDDVTYAVSGDSGVASVDASSGVVTLLGATGTVTITASAPATDDFQSGSASYTLTVTNSAPQTYTMATEITVGASYLVVSVGDDKVFTGVKAGTASDVEPVNGVITDANCDFAGYEFTVEKNEDVYYLKFNDGKYLVCDYGTYGSSAGLRYVDTQADVQYPYTLTIDNSTFFFNTTQITAGSADQYLYYKSSESCFKIGGSGAPGKTGGGVHLYMKN